MSIESEKFCEACRISDAKRDEGLVKPDTITAITDIRYAQREDYNTLDVYYPVDTKDKLPTVLNIHGGGYVYGDTKLYSFYCMSLAERGFAVVSFNYRLAPDYKFPSPIYDINDCLKWITDNCEAYHLDTSNLFLIGDSAGAQLASQYGVIYSNPDYAELFGITVPNVKLRALSLACGIYDVKASVMSMKPGDSKLEDYYTHDWKTFGDMLDPLKYINENYPPTFVFSSYGDFLLPCCEPMAKLISERGGYAISKLYGDEQTYHVFHCDMRSHVGIKANDDQAEFMKKYVVK